MLHHHCSFVQMTDISIYTVSCFSRAQPVTINQLSLAGGFKKPSERQYFVQCKGTNNPKF